MAWLLSASIILPSTGTEESAVHMNELKRGSKVGEEFEHISVFDVMSQDDIGIDLLDNLTSPAETFERAASGHQLRAVNRICELLIGFDSVDDNHFMTGFPEQARDISEIAFHAADHGRMVVDLKKLHFEKMFLVRSTGFSRVLGG